LVLNPLGDFGESETVGLLRVSRAIPLAAGSVLGVALDASFPSEIVFSAVDLVRPAGRLVGPEPVDAPAGVTVLARDGTYWVAEKPAEMISLERRKLGE